MPLYHREEPMTDAAAPRAVVRETADADAFDRFARDVEPRLWRALVANFGPSGATEAAADGLVYAWRHWERVQSMANPSGYLYRVAFRSAQNSRSRALTAASASDPLPAQGLPDPAVGAPDFEPGLVAALRSLSEMQRTVVWLVEGCGWGLTDTANLLGLSVSTVRNHLARGLKGLRAALKVTSDD